MQILVYTYNFQDCMTCFLSIIGSFTASCLFFYGSLLGYHLKHMNHIFIVITLTLGYLCCKNETVRGLGLIRLNQLLIHKHIINIYLTTCTSNTKPLHIMLTFVTSCKIVYNWDYALYYIHHLISDVKRCTFWRTQTFVWILYINSINNAIYRMTPLCSIFQPNSKFQLSNCVQ